MKKRYLKLGLLAIVLFITSIVQAQISVGAATPNEHSMMDITASDKGILIPRMTTAERTALGVNLLVTPQAAEIGLLVFDTDDKNFYYWLGTTWSGGLVSTVSGFSTSSRGEVYMENVTENKSSTDLTTTAMLVDVNPDADHYAVGKDLVNFTSDATGRLTYTGSGSQTFTVTITLSVQSHSTNKDFNLYVATGNDVTPTAGAIIAETKTIMEFDVNHTSVYPVIMSTITLAPNDWVELWGESQAGTEEFEVFSYRMLIE